MADGYMVPTGMYQGYSPMVGQGMMLPPADATFAGVAGTNSVGQQQLVGQAQVATRDAR